MREESMCWCLVARARARADVPADDVCCNRVCGSFRDSLPETGMITGTHRVGARRRTRRHARRRARAARVGARARRRGRSATLALLPCRESQSPCGANCDHCASHPSRRSSCRPFGSSGQHLSLTTSCTVLRMPRLPSGMLHGVSNPTSLLATRAACSCYATALVTICCTST